MQRRGFAIAGLLVCALVGARCGGENADSASAPVPVTRGADAASARRADAEWRDAAERGDAARAAAMLDDDFEWTDSHGRTRSRTEAIENLPALAAGLRGEGEVQHYHYGHVHVVTSSITIAATSGSPSARMMRVWTLRPDGWRAFGVISTALASGATPFAAAGAAAGAGTAECDNPCRTMPFTPATDNAKQIAAIFQKLKLDEWHPNPVEWAPYVLDDVYYVTATARLSKADRVAHLTKMKETGAPSIPGDPVVSMRIDDFGEAAVMVARHDPYRGGQPYYSLRVWARRDGRWQLANTQQTVIADAPPAGPAREVR